MADPLDVNDSTGEVRRGVVAVIVREARFLVIRRSQWVAAPRAFCFPGGGIEAGESEPTALQRELIEELQLIVEPRHCLWRSMTPWGVDLSWWLAECPAEITLRPTPSEVESVHWFTADEMTALPDLLASNRAFLDAWSRGEFQLPGA